MKRQNKVERTDQVENSNSSEENVKGSKGKKGRFEKIDPGLYRYIKTGVYYSFLKKDGKTRWKCLNVTDRPTARRLLAQDRDQVESVDSNLSGLECGALTDKYLEIISGKARKTISTRKGIIKRLLAHLSQRKKIRDVKPSDLQTWAATLSELEERSYNEYIRVAKDIFRLAVDDKVVAKSPAAELKRKKLKALDRRTPTLEQFRAIIVDVRAQIYNADAEASGDFLEFMALAGLGQAELRNFRICDIIETREIKMGVEQVVKRMDVRRQKTGGIFRVPIYPQVEKLLKKLVDQASKTEPQSTEEKIAFPLRRLFKINDAKKALTSSCKRLGYPSFEQRSLRRLFITQAVEKGLDFKVIAATQGHKDGGVLVAKTYSHLRQDHFDAMAAKLVSE